MPAAVTVTVLVKLVPFAVAVTVTVALAATALEVNGMVVDVALAGIVTVAGTVPAAVFEDERLTV